MPEDHETPNTYPIANIAAVLLQRRKASSIHAAIRTAYDIWTQTTIFLDEKLEEKKAAKRKARTASRRKAAHPAVKSASLKVKRKQPSKAG